MNCHTINLESSGPLSCPLYLVGKSEKNMFLSMNQHYCITPVAPSAKMFHVCRGRCCTEAMQRGASTETGQLQFRCLSSDLLTDDFVLMALKAHILF